eukprot:g30810.t1
MVCLRFGSCLKARSGEDLNKVFIVIDNLLKDAKNMTKLFHSREVLDNEGYPIKHILYLSFEVIMVFCCGTSELAIDELSIVSCSYEDIFQHLQVSVLFLLIRTDPVYATSDQRYTPDTLTTVSSFGLM